MNHYPSSVLLLVFPAGAYFLYCTIGANVLQLCVDVGEDGPYVL